MEIKRGDRVRRKSGGPEGTVLRVYETWLAPKRMRAEVRWMRTLHGGSRIGTGGTDWKSAGAVERLVKVSP